MKSISDFLFFHTRPWERLLVVFGIAVLFILALAFGSEAFGTYHFESDFVPQYVEFSAGQIWTGTRYVDDANYGYALFERSISVPTEHSLWPYYAFLGVTLLGFILFVTGLTALRGIWLWIATGVLAVCGPFLIPDALIAVEWQHRALQMAAALALGGSVFMLSGSPLPYLRRAWVVVALQAGWLLPLALLANQATWPALLAGYGILPSYVLTLLLIMQLAFAIPYALFQLVVRNNISPVASFAMLMLFYGGNLLLTYYHSRGTWDGSLFYFNGLWLLSIAAVAGLRMFHDFAEAGYSWYDENTEALPLTYAGLVLIAAATLGLSVITDNAAMVEVADDTVMLTFFGAAVGFLIYTLFNFWEPLMKGLRVDRVFFDPRYVPVFALPATMATLAFIFFAKDNKFQYYQAKAGYYNGIADAWRLSGEWQSAKDYYEYAVGNEFYNLKANLNLARIAGRSNDLDKQEIHLKAATDIKGNPEAFAFYSNHFADRGRFFESIFALKDGLKKFPTDSRLLSNYLVLMAGNREPDSVEHYTRRLADADLSSRQVQMNLSALLAQGRLSKDFARLPKASTHLAVAANLALYKVQTSEKCGESGTYKPDTSEATMLSFIPLVTTMAACPDARNDTVARNYLNSLVGVQAGLTEDARYALALGQWQRGEVRKAFTTMDELAATSLYQKPFFYKKAITWALSLHAPQLAATLARNAGAAQIGLPKALVGEVQLQAGQTTGNPSPFTFEEGLGMAEEARYPFLIQHGPDMLPVEAARLIVSFSEPELQWQGYSAISTLWLQQRRYAEMAELAQRLRPSLDTAIRSQAAVLARDAQIRAAWHISSAGSGQFMPASGPAKSGQPFMQLISAMRAAPDAKRIQAIVARNPFDADLVFAAAQFLEQNNQPEAAFEITRDALQLGTRPRSIQEMYIGLCRKLGYDSFAESALEQYVAEFGPLLEGSYK